MCPGFSDKDIAQISDLVGENVGICVTRGDSNTNKIIARLMNRVNYTIKKHYSYIAYLNDTDAQGAAVLGGL
ncbi:MAG: hypothetical protein NHB14_12260 [Desulfosporosinus sp.]|nr:hypothetical protein [Desulfosporosinus sp.]